MCEDSERQAADINAAIGNLAAERTEPEKSVGTGSPLLTAYRKYENMDKLTRDID